TGKARSAVRARWWRRGKATIAGSSVSAGLGAVGFTMEAAQRLAAERAGRQAAVAQKPVGLGCQGVQALLDQNAGTLHAGRVEIGRHFDRLAPEKDAAREREGQVETVPAAENAPVPGRIGQGDHRRAR